MTNSFGNKTIKKTLKPIIEQIKPRQSFLYEYLLQNESLSSEEFVFETGLFPQEYDFVTIIPGTLIKDRREGSLGGFQFGHSLDFIAHNRSIYNALDFLGDIGGLLSILEGIG